MYKKNVPWWWRCDLLVDLVEVPLGLKKVRAFLNGVVIVFTQEGLLEDDVDEEVAIFSIFLKKIWGYEYIV